MAEYIVIGIGYEGNTTVVYATDLRDAYFDLAGIDDEDSIADFAESNDITDEDEWNDWDWLEEIQSMDSADFVLQGIWDVDENDWFYLDDDVNYHPYEEVAQWEWDDFNHDWLDESKKPETKALTISEALKKLKPVNEIYFNNTVHLENDIFFYYYPLQSQESKNFEERELQVKDVIETEDFVRNTMNFPIANCFAATIEEGGPLIFFDIGGTAYLYYEPDGSEKPRIFNGWEEALRYQYSGELEDGTVNEQFIQRFLSQLEDAKNRWVAKYRS